MSPLAFAGLRAAGTRPVVPLGRFGTLVNDPVLGRRILTDPAPASGPSGRGTHGELMDLAIGPDALLNMDGPAHEALRRDLGPLFSPAASAEIVAGTAAGPIEEAAARLRDGETVDLVRLVRVLTGRTTFALLGAPPPRTATRGISPRIASASSSLA